MRLLGLVSGLFVLALAGCAPPGAADFVDRRDVAGLHRALVALGPGVDDAEAARLARVVYDHTDRLAREYEITDSAIVHNMKVNAGLKPRGLCKDWADDIEARLRQEGFRSFTLHRAIANAQSLRLDHSTVIVSRRGDSMYDGIVIDPWRFAGKLYWGPTVGDHYAWVPRRQVFEAKLRRSPAAGSGKIAVPAAAVGN